MGHTKENSATYLLTSNFKGSMRINAFVRYLGLNINLSKYAILEDGTHKSFDTESVKLTSEPDMFILDDTNKVLILIENKVKIDRELEESQTSEDGYLAILKDYSKLGYSTFLYYLVPKQYYFLNLLNEVCKKHKNVKVLDWNTFLDNFDTDEELVPVKRAIQAIQIDGVELEDDLYNRPIDFGVLAAGIIKEQKKAELYIGQLIYDACEGIDEERKSLWGKGKKVGAWQYVRSDIWDSDTNYSSYTDVPCIEIIINNDDKYYIVCGYDLIHHKFCLYIQNCKNWKSIVIQNSKLSLPFGDIKSYYAIKDKLQIELYDFISENIKSVNSIKELK